MKASLRATVECPQCGQVMTYIQTQKVLLCANAFCELYFRAFDLPVVEITDKLKDQEVTQVGSQK